jgi:uncharacterized membrane protein YdbT with pleckstrin-like domain
MQCIEPEQLSPRGRSFFELIEFDEEEQLVGEIRKHPFGLFIIYFTGTLATVILMVALVLVPLMIKDDPTGSGFDIASIRAILVGIGFLLTVLGVIITSIAAYLYQRNVVLITTDKLTQMLYTSIFNRKISQVSIGHVQDVTVKQIGVFARIFNYGTLVIETAGEQENYDFTFTPQPYETAKVLVAAHEENLKKYGN